MITQQDKNKKLLLAQVRPAKLVALQLSREIPTRPCSPYGGLEIDHEAIKMGARMAFEALFAVEQDMLPDTRKSEDTNALIMELRRTVRALQSAQSTEIEAAEKAYEMAVTAIEQAWKKALANSQDH
jgi:hypothetical protein